MGLKFNPFSGGFDNVGYTGGDLTVTGRVSATGGYEGLELGPLNYSQTQGTQVTITGAGETIVSTTIATSGNPVQIIATGEGEPSAAGYIVVQLYRDSTPIGKATWLESNGSSENVPYTLHFIDNPSAASYTYSVKSNNIAGGTWKFGEITNTSSVIAAIELANVAGPKGDTGLTGPTGPTGATGIQGVQGTQGISIQGTRGVQGAIGIQGLVGSGLQGVQGSTGVQGSAGAQGTLGIQGTVGTQGIIGVQGAQGIFGIQGITGAGVQGLQGSTGDRGIQGIFGIQGITGAGVQGLQGSTGDRGIQGTFGTQGITGAGIQGLQGNTGEQGIQGTDGIQGITGAGIQGLQGNTGEQGIQGTLGTQGTTGAGIQGLDGSQGLQGLQGEAIQGIQGAQGIEGAQGLFGIQGIQGFDGSQGIQGAQGIEGAQGLFGIQGIQGFDGSQGVQGGQGVQGVRGVTFDYTAPSSYSTTLGPNAGYIFNTGTANSPLTAILPSSPTVGAYINITFERGNDYNLTIQGAGKKINGSTEDLICDVSGTFSLIYTDDNSVVGWKFVPFSGLTIPTIKVYEASWVGPYQGPQDNLGSNSRIPYNTNVINTDTSTFGGLSLSGSKTTTSIHIKTTGIYQITSNLHLYDQLDGRNLYVQLWTYDSVNGDVKRTALNDFNSGINSTTNDLIITGTTILNITQPNTYVYIVVNHDFPGNGPFPSAVDAITSNLDTAPTEITITKLS